MTAKDDYKMDVVNAIMSGVSTPSEAPKKPQYKYAYKWLTYDGATKTDYGITYYELPRPGQKYGEWMIHPEPAEPDGSDCGAGRYHLMKRPDKRYAAERSWLWVAEYDVEDVIGESAEKVGVRRLRLRRVNEEQFIKLIRRGYCSSANLSYANLSSADLRYANLSYANLSSADLRSADLSYADLSSADLSYANLSYANLSSADLRSADLSYANLSSADLRSADLRSADLRYADLSYAGIVLEGSYYNKYTMFSEGFDPKQVGMAEVG